MKYEVPEINISKFSEENVVTVSSTEIAKAAVEATLGSDAHNVLVTRVDLDSWVAQQ